MPRKGERKAQAVGNSGSSTAKKKTTRGSSAAVAKKGRTGTAAGKQESTLPEDDAVALLKADHRAVETLFAQYEAADSREERARLAQQICRSLSIHARLEDELFYPACRERGVETDLMDEAQVEHDGAAMLIEELLASAPDAPFRDAKVKVLGEYIQMHVREEEKPSGGIFAQARSAGLDMSELGQRIKSRKQELEMQAQTRTLHPPTPRSLGTDTSPHYGEHNMARFNQERDEQGRFVSDDDRRSSGRDRDDDRRYSRSRDDDDRSSSMRRDRDDDDRGRYSSRGRDDDDRGRSGRDRDDDDRSRYSSRGRDDDRDNNGRDDGRGHGQGGWFGDSEGHSRAAQRGWESRRDDDDDRGGSRSGSRYRSDDSRSRSGEGRGRSDDDRGRYSSRGRDDDRDDGRGHGGWFGDSEGHSRAAQRGWESRRDDDDDDRGGSSRSGRYRSDDSRSRSGGGDDRGQGGWFGDSEGHSRAAQRGWESRRDDDRQGSRSGR